MPVSRRRKVNGNYHILAWVAGWMGSKWWVSLTAIGNWGVQLSLSICRTSKTRNPVGSWVRRSGGILGQEAWIWAWWACWQHWMPWAFGVRREAELAVHLQRLYTCETLAEEASHRQSWWGIVREVEVKVVRPVMGEKEEGDNNIECPPEAI